MKTLFKVLFIINWLGWFPFMWTAIYASRHPEYAFWVVITGLIICLFSVLSFQSFIMNNNFWLKQKELEDRIVEYENAVEYYRNVTKKLTDKIEQL